VSDDGENCITVAPGANHALREADIDAAADCIAGAAVLVCQLEIPLEVVRRAIEVASAARVMVLLNPAPAALLPDTMLTSVNVLIPNESEAADLAGARDAVEAAVVLRRRGAHTVLVTLGANGVLLVDQQGSRAFPAYPARAIDTTGAGDAFVGALAVALAEKESLHDAIDFAQRAAAFSVEHRGAQDAMARRSELPPRRAVARGPS